MERPLVSIIIVNWNGREILRKCLNSIRENTEYPYYRVVVVDNGSVDGSVEMIKKEFPYVKLIQNKENLGFAKATNQGIKSIESDYYFLLNNDTVVTKNWLTNMIKISESDSNIGIVGCKLIFPNGRIQQGGREIREVDYVTGAAFLIKKEVIDKIGLLDDKFFSPLFYEETDYCVRARKAGYKIIYNPNTVIIHHSGYSLKKHKSNFIYFIAERNRIRFMLLNFPSSWLIVRMPYEMKRLGAMLLGRYGKMDRLEILRLLAKAWLVNLKNLKEILKRRHNDRL